MASGRHSNKQVRERAIEAWNSGISVSSIAKSFGASRMTIYRWIDRFNERGFDGLTRSKTPGSGRPLLLSAIGDNRFISLALAGARMFGYESDLWTSNRLARAVSKAFNLDVSGVTIWRHLRRLGLTYQRPQRQFHEADERKRAKWRRYELPKILRCVAQKKGILYFQDEAHISMVTSLGKMWAKKGQTPVMKSPGKRASVSALSSISDKGKSLLFKVVDTRVNSDVVIEFLGEMLRHHKRRHLIVVMDNARPHTSKKTKAFAKSQNRLHIFYLPPYSPDYNPDEKVWNHAKNVELRDNPSETKDELYDNTVQALTKMSDSPRLLKGLYLRSVVTNFLK